ncbi:homeotic protein spalt-major-like [Culicoides brevitarsis]|uniref:homeotic protein spalt-major-like n=1 Tax=Culicoides brevitarsis TaxID=469753 RepID=UPI00307BEB47
MSRRKQYRPVRVQEEDDKINDNIKSSDGGTTTTNEPLTTEEDEKGASASNVVKSINAETAKVKTKTIERNVLLPTNTAAAATKTLKKLIENKFVNENNLLLAQVAATSDEINGTGKRVNDSSELVNGDDGSTMHGLAFLQSTFFALQQQQMMQMKWIQELQSQIKDPPEKVSNEATTSEDIEKQIKEIKIEVKDGGKAGIVDDSPREAPSELRISPKSIQKSENDQPLSLAESIIMDHEPPTQVSSLEMLQKRTQEVLANATQSLNNGSLTEELAYLRENGSANEANYKHRCRYCGKIFGSDSALQIHLRSHTGERPFKCNMCSSSFTTKGNLKVHYQRHQQDNAFMQMNPGQPLPGNMNDRNGGDSPPPPPTPARSMSPATPGSVNMTRPPSFQFPPNFALPGFPFPFPRPPMELLEKLRMNIYEAQKTMENERNIEEAAAAKNLEKQRRSPLEKPEEVKRIKLEAPKTPEMKTTADENARIRSLRSYKSFSDTKSESRSPLPTTKTTPPPPHTKSPINYNLVLPRFGSKDKSWEKYIEVTKTPETSKLQQLVDNIENKLQDPNECPACHKVLSCKSSLLMHYRIHTGEKPFRCKICGRPFTTKGNLKVHMSIHRVKEPFAGFNACPICHQKFDNIFQLQDHIRSHTMDHEKYDYDESVDSSMDLSSPNLDTEHDDEEALDLAYTEMRERHKKMENELREHAKTETQRLDENEENSEAKSPFKAENCSKCGKIINRELIDDDDVCICDMDKNTKIEAMMMMVMRQRRDNDEKDAMEEQRKEVESPQDRQEEAVNLKKRSRSPSSETEGINNQTSYSPKHLDNKVRSADDELSSDSSKPLMYDSDQHLKDCCDTLSPITQQLHSFTVKELNNLANSNNHHSPPASSPSSTSASAASNQKHYCRMCKRNFSSSSALQIHTRTHTGDRPFVCHVCSKSFTTKGNLKVHMGTHMWTNTASRRGRRMSLELPLTRPLNISQQDAEFLQHRPELFYPYLPPPFLNGMAHKLNDVMGHPPMSLLHSQMNQGKFPFPPFSLPAMNLHARSPSPSNQNINNSNFNGSNDRKSKRENNNEENEDLPVIKKEKEEDSDSEMDTELDLSVKGRRNGANCD